MQLRWLQGVRARRTKCCWLHTCTKSTRHKHCCAHVTRHTFLDPLVAVTKHTPPQAREIHRYLHPGVKQLCVVVVEQHATRHPLVLALLRKVCSDSKRGLVSGLYHTSARGHHNKLWHVTWQHKHLQHGSGEMGPLRLGVVVVCDGQRAAARGVSRMARQMRVTLHAG